MTGRINREHRAGPVSSVAVVIRSGRGRARLDRDRSDLVATVAHELRSPLTGVKGFVGTLLNKWDRLNDEQKQLMLRTVYADSERLSRLIAELLDVARIDTGRLPLYPRPRSTCGRSWSGAWARCRPARTREIETTYDDAVPHRLRRPRQAHPGGHQHRRQRRAARRGDRARARPADRRARSRER